ncbi:MAG TPA: DNA sulfur modification protein DndB [Acidimicrobiales bacterium]|nr:DNA sulfur modification protein DndB [Acidimicrobiales bacterium]
MAFKHTFNVPATRGRMGNTEFFTGVFPLGAVAKLFAYDPYKMAGLLPEQRTQRELKKNRIPEIAEYILEHDDYVFSSVTVSVGGKIEFEPVEEGSDIGTLKLPLGVEFTVNDGQHRVAGIAEALSQDITLENDSISVVILPDEGRERSQQIFSDLNRTVHKTSKSLDILFDHRLPINRITMMCVERVPLFKGKIDKERVSLSVNARQFATLSGLRSANDQLLGELAESLDPEEYHWFEDLAIEFWTTVTDYVEPWSEIASGDVKPHEARAGYISSYALALWAVGSAGKTAMEQDPDGWQEIVKGLADVDWRKSNRDWKGICMTGNEVVTRAPTRRATADYLRWKLGLGDKPEKVI